MLSDLRLGLRHFLRRPGIALAAVLSLALGIGANSAIFSVLHSVVLNPLPYRSPERLVIVWETSSDNPERWVAPANFVDWRRESRSFESLAAFDEFSPTLAGRAEPERLRAVGASGTFFTTLGVTASLGRTLLPSDDEPDASGAAVLSHGLWARLFGAGPDAIGQTLRLDGRSYTIVGVMGASFESPLSAGVDVWLSGDGESRTFPFGGDLTNVRDSHIIYVVGRLAAGRQPRGCAARAEHDDGGAGTALPRHQRRPWRERPAVAPGRRRRPQRSPGTHAVGGRDDAAHRLCQRRAPAARSGRGPARRDDGASRTGRSAGASCVNCWPKRWLLIPAACWGSCSPPGDSMRSSHLPLAAFHAWKRSASTQSQLLFTTGVTFLTAAAVRAGAGFQLARQSVNTPSHASFRLAGGRNVRRWHHAIVVTELAMAQVLLIGAGLLLASFVASQRVPSGFETDGRIADLNLAPDKACVPSRRKRSPSIRLKIGFVQRVLEQLKSATGVRAAAASLATPPTGAPNRDPHRGGAASNGSQRGCG